jgi:hypothetical protein
MKSALVWSAALLVAAVAGRAGVEAESPSEAKAPRDYRTGSNLPVRDGLPAATEADREQAAEQVRALQRTFEKGKPPGAGG